MGVPKFYRWVRECARVGERGAAGESHDEPVRAWADVCAHARAWQRLSKAELARGGYAAARDAADGGLALCARDAALVLPWRCDLVVRYNLVALRSGGKM